MKSLLSPDLRRRARQRRQRLLHPAWFGTVRRTRPVSEQWGRERGHEIDRVYIEHFLNAHCYDIRGHVLEVKESVYTDRFGRGVTCADVLDIDASNPNATVVADLASLAPIADGTIDCFILTQTLQFIADPRQALNQVHRILSPSGVVLVTVPGLSRVERAFAATDYWRFTPASCRLLFREVFGPERVEVHPYGNVLVAMAFLTGLAREDLTRQELDDQDQHFPVIVAVRAVKADQRP
jgi:SAM-dependent methyltransferase